MICSRKTYPYLPVNSRLPQMENILSSPRPPVLGITVDFRLLAKAPYANSALLQEALERQGVDCTNVPDSVVAAISQDHSTRIS